MKVLVKEVLVDGKIPFEKVLRESLLAWRHNWIQETSNLKIQKVFPKNVVNLSGDIS